MKKPEGAAHGVTVDPFVGEKENMLRLVDKLDDALGGKGIHSKG